jgi:hypothetical protein
VGFEWTSAPRYQNLHRCVIFADKGPERPYSAFDSENPEDLWTYLEQQRRQGLDVVAIPHNGNASNGLMFDVKDMSGRPLTREYAVRRMTNEPLAEIIQGKGQSDTSPALSPTDEFADFEMWVYLIGSDQKANAATAVTCARPRWARAAGEARANPSSTGSRVARTSTHLSSTEASNYPGSHGVADNDPKAVLTATTSVGMSRQRPWAPGLTGVGRREH